MPRERSKLSSSTSVSDRGSSRALPPPVYAGFIDILFEMGLPILGLGLVFVGVTALGAYHWWDAILGGLAVAGATTTAARFGLIVRYKIARPTVDLTALLRWESLYALGTYAFALLLAILILRSLTYREPLLHLISLSLFFSFGAGTVSRISVRPRICVTSILVVGVPTIGALLAHAAATWTASPHGKLYATEAFLVAMISGLSLQTVAHLYRSAALHHTTEHDLGLLAKRDALTGLPNRLLLRDRFKEAGAGTRLAIHFIDLDGFKPVNDVHGHPAGDAVLQEVGRRLDATVRATDTVARLGGDEFVVLQVNVAQDSEAEFLARRIVKSLSMPYDLDGKLISISASVGIATNLALESDLDFLMSCADHALYRSKSGGKNRLNFCTELDVQEARKAA